MMSTATHNALLARRPSGKRTVVINRSTSVGAGRNGLGIILALGIIIVHLLLVCSVLRQSTRFPWLGMISVDLVRFIDFLSMSGHELIVD